MVNYDATDNVRYRQNPPDSTTTSVQLTGAFRGNGSNSINLSFRSNNVARGQQTVNDEPVNSHIYADEVAFGSLTKYDEKSGFFNPDIR